MRAAMLQMPKDEAFYYFNSDDGFERGPVSATMLGRLIREDQLHERTLVRRVDGNTYHERRDLFDNNGQLRKDNEEIVEIEYFLDDDEDAAQSPARPLLMAATSKVSAPMSSMPVCAISAGDEEAVWDRRLRRRLQNKKATHTSDSESGDAAHADMVPFSNLSREEFINKSQKIHEAQAARALWSPSRNAAFERVRVAPMHRMQREEVAKLQHKEEEAVVFAEAVEQEEAVVFAERLNLGTIELEQQDQAVQLRDAEQKVEAIALAQRENAQRYVVMHQEQTHRAKRITEYLCKEHTQHEERCEVMVIEQREQEAKVEAAEHLLWALNMDMTEQTAMTEAMEFHAKAAMEAVKEVEEDENMSMSKRRLLKRGLRR